jgi:hypothetical protein
MLAFCAVHEISGLEQPCHFLPLFIQASTNSLIYANLDRAMSRKILLGRARKIVRWWMFIPFLIVLIGPGWVWLGDYLRIDMMPVPGGGGSQPRYDNDALSFSYFCFFMLIILADLPGILVARLAGRLIPPPALFVTGLFISAVIYSVLLFLIGWAFQVEEQRRLQGGNVPSSSCFIKTE